MYQMLQMVKKYASIVIFPNSKIYYSASMPYYSKSKIRSCYAYKKAYLKQRSGTVYAVAVVDGRIVASDAVYVSVSKASSPSKLKLNRLQKNSALISWKAASVQLHMKFTEVQANQRSIKRLQLFLHLKNLYKNKKLKRNKKYYYKVRAVRKGYVNSKYSNIVSAKTKYDNCLN